MFFIIFSTLLLYSLYYYYTRKKRMWIQRYPTVCSVSYTGFNLLDARTIKSHRKHIITEKRIIL